MTKLTAHVHGVLTLGKLLNGYLIVNGQEVTIIDAGVSAGFVKTIEKKLQELGLGWSNVTNILITHNHPDHIGGLAELQKHTNAPTLIHRLDASVVRGEQPQQMADPSTLGFFGRIMQNGMRSGSGSIIPARVDGTFDDGDTLNQVLPNLTVVQLDGHSYGQSGFWIPEEKTLIGGDVLMNFPIMGLVMPVRIPSVDWERVKVSIKRVDELGVENLLMGHGAPLIGNAHQVVRALIAKKHL